MSDPHSRGWETSAMLDGMALRPGSLRDSQPGSLFVPADDESGASKYPFVAGTVNTVRVLVCLGGEDRFRLAEPRNWSNRAGYHIDNVQFEVDRSTAIHRRSEEDIKLGELMRVSGCLSMMGIEKQGMHLVDVAGAASPDDGPPLIGFSRWEIVLGTGADRHVLYHYTGENLLFGPYDPITDENE